MRSTVPTQLTDHELQSQVKHFARCEREATAQLVAHLAEFDARKLYRGAGFPSLFAYCREVLGFSENETYNRIEAARAAKRFPVILSLLTSASVNLTTVRLLAPHLTGANHQELLAAATGLSKRQVEELLARHFPRPDVAPSIRKLPVARPAVNAPVALEARDPASASAAPSHVGAASTPGGQPAVASLAEPSAAPAFVPSCHRPLATPLAIDRYQIRFTASTATWEKLRLARDLLRHAVPSGDPAEIFDRALTVLIADLARRKCALVKRPQGRGRPTAAGSRTVPASVRRVVFVRDQGRCAFVAPSGRRCGERAFLEFHHVKPYAAGGEATIENIQLRCASHNQYEAVLFYGSHAPRRDVRAPEPRNGLSAGDATRSGTGSGYRSSARINGAQPG